jgi:superfamily II DNA/RNA helicase
VIAAGRKFGSWDDLKLSRPLTKAIGLLNYAAPTPIQVQAVPAALQGHDLVCSAITGSGTLFPSFFLVISFLC